MSSAQTVTQPAATHWRRFRSLYALLLVCVTPVIASYLAYYVWQPSGRTNYGELLSPQRPVPALNLKQLDGTAFDFTNLRGKWVMLHIDVSTCEQACTQKLWLMRQLRLTQGKDSDRIERVMLVADDAPMQTQLLREFDGTVFLRARSDELQTLFSSNTADHIWLIDPLGNLMLRWPQQPDPNRMKKDLGKLLKASRVG